MLALVMRRATAPVSRPLVCTLVRSLSSDGGGITYSGGHASTGQGGFYGSGGARANKENSVEQRTEAVAQMEDVQVRDLGIVLLRIKPSVSWCARRFCVR